MNRYYNNHNHITNGELFLYRHISGNIRSLFDVGAREDTYYLDNQKIEYHLFEPNDKFYQTLITKTKDLPHTITINNFGLGMESKTLPYYSHAQSFCQRKFYTSKGKDLKPDLTFQIRRLDAYLEEKKISEVDFIKIDTEGFEYDVLIGAGSQIPKFKLIQFEYGGTYPDRKIKLAEVTSILTKHDFYIYLITPKGLILTDDFDDHYQYCNYLAVRKDSQELISQIVLDSTN